MARQRPSLGPVLPYCSIERALVLLGDRWSFLVLREILLYGESRFADLQSRLGIASNVLTDRLDTLVDGGVLERRHYQAPGSRARFGYHPTRAGLDLKLPLAALQQWGDAHEPRAEGPTVSRNRVTDGASVSVAFMTGQEPLAVDEVEFRPTSAYPEQFSRRRE